MRFDREFSPAALSWMKISLNQTFLAPAEETIVYQTMPENPGF